MYERWSNKLISVQAYLTHALVAADPIREYSRSAHKINYKFCNFTRESIFISIEQSLISFSDLLHLAFDSYLRTLNQITCTETVINWNP